MLGHTVAAHLVAPLRVRGERRVARMLLRFALVERGSQFTLRWAAERTTSEERRVLYLRHALDEARHAHMFERRARELGLSSPAGAADAEDLFATLGERRFLAFVTLAEGRGRREFESVRRALEARGDEKSVKLFDAVLVDERRHERYSRELLIAAAGSPFLASLSVVYVALWETIRASRRGASTLGRALYAGLLALLYFVLLPPFALLVRRARPLRAGWTRPR